MAFRVCRLARMDETQRVYTEEPNIYAAGLHEQDPDMALNTVFWRLAVALGYAEVGDSMTIASPDDILELAEDVIWRYKELSK